MHSSFYQANSNHHKVERLGNVFKFHSSDFGFITGVTIIRFRSLISCTFFVSMSLSKSMKTTLRLKTSYESSLSLQCCKKMMGPHWKALTSQTVCSVDAVHHQLLQGLNNSSSPNPQYLCQYHNSYRKNFACTYYLNWVVVSISRELKWHHFENFG